MPAAATAPALILVGVADDVARGGDSLERSYASAIPAFLTMLTIPLTFSIATGLSFGFTSFAVLKLARGEFAAEGLGGVPAGGDFRGQIHLPGIRLTSKG